MIEWQTPQNASIFGPLRCPTRRYFVVGVRRVRVVAAEALEAPALAEELAGHLATLAFTEARPYGWLMCDDGRVALAALRRVLVAPEAERRRARVRLLGLGFTTCLFGPTAKMISPFAVWMAWQPVHPTASWPPAASAESRAARSRG